MLARVKVIHLAILVALSLSGTSRAQTRSDDSAQQQATAEKFLQLLLNRPQSGTALDKTIEYYQSMGELDALSERVKTQAKELQASQPEAAARHWLALALVAQAQSRWLESIELLRQAPDVAQHRWAIGQTQAVAGEQLQRWQAIIEVLQPLIDQAIQEPGQGSAESVIESARRLAKAYSRLGQSENAIKVWQQLESRFGRDEQIATRLANMAADEGELDFAVAVLDRILAGKLPATKRIELAIERTSLMARAGHEDAALASYEQLLAELNTDSWLAADIARRIEDLIVGRDGIEALLTYYRSQLAKRPDDLNVSLRLATRLDSEKQWTEADKLFNQLLERTSSAVAPRLAYAQSLVHQERWHDAANAFSKLVELQPRDDDLTNQWCEAISNDESLAKSQRETKIRSILESRIEGAAPTAQAYQQLASRLQHFGQAERAADWLVKAYQLQPNDLSVLSDYSRALLDLGRETDVLQATHAFHVANLANREALAQLADLYADLDYGDLALDCLSRACQLNPNSTMRMRLCEWLEKAQRPIEAAKQLELAWNEIAKQTASPAEQEALCEELTRRQIQLAMRSGMLEESLGKLQSTDASHAVQPALAGLEPEAVTAWRLAKFLGASGNSEEADERVVWLIQQQPNNTLVWRLRAQLDEQAKRLPEAIEAHRKLAELDVRRRSEHLLEVAKGLARMGRIDDALQQAEVITTETASSQHVIEVFNLAIDNHAEKFAMSMLENRLQARPGDLEVLQRLIRYHLDKNSLQQAAAYQRQYFQLMRTPEQRQVAVELLIETHVQLRSLNKLQQQLEKYWRQHDLWREFGVWQAMIALRGDNYQRAEELLARLTQSQTTRRFALDHSLRLAELQGNSLKRLELMKQLAAIDAQAVSGADIAKLLIELPEEQRLQIRVDDVLDLVRNSGKRLALIQDLIQAGSVDMALRIIEVLPEQEKQSWPIVVRAALAWAALPPNKETPPTYVQSALGQLQKFTDQPLALPDTLVGEPLLAELLDSQKTIAEFLVTTTFARQGQGPRLAISQEATNCHSALQAYQAVIAAQLQVAETPAERRDILAKHRRVAMQQTSPRERAARLAAQAIVSHWQTRMPTFQSGENVKTPNTFPDGSFQDSFFRKRIRDTMAASLPREEFPLVRRLADFSPALQYVVVELTELADQGEPLASLLCLWETALARRDLFKLGNERNLQRSADYCRNLGPYESLAPAQLVTLLATLQIKDHPEQADEILKTLASLAIDEYELQHVLQSALERNDLAVVQALIAAHAGRTNCLAALGQLAGSRDPQASPTSLWRAVDYVWQSEVKQGLRSAGKLTRVHATHEFPWIKALPLCSVPMHESSVFHQLDFNIARAIIARAQSNSSRQELLDVIKQLAEEPASNDLRLVRQLARVFVLELLEQDAQSSKLLDVALPAENSSTDPSFRVLRGLWQDVIGKHDAATEWWLKFHDWPEEVRETTAALMLDLALQQHHDGAIDVAVKELCAATRDLSYYHTQVDELIRRDRLPQAEALLGEFRVLLPPNDKPLVINAQVMKLTNVNEQLIVRWGQTDSLFSLLQKYAQLDDKESAFRIARRLIGGAEYAADDEFREHLSNLVLRLQKSFKNAVQLTEFIELESHQLDPKATPRQALCVLRLVADAGYVGLAQEIVERMTSGQLTALQYLEIARCELKLDQIERAAQFFARAFELQPDWLESSIGGLDDRRQFIEAFAREMNKSSNPGAGIGVRSFDLLRKAIPSGELTKYSQLWIGWAGNSRVKTLEQMRTLLSQLRKVDFRLWTSVVEQLLLSDELQPVTIAYDDPSHWLNNLKRSSQIEQMLDLKLNAAESSEFQAMLQRVVLKTSDDFLARLLLARNFISLKDWRAAADQLPQLVRSDPRGSVKGWLLTAWQTEVAKRQATANTPAALANAQQQAAHTVSSIGLDKAARGKLLLRLLESWDSGNEQAANRVLLAERILEWYGLAALSPVWQSELLKFYVAQRDQAKVLALFDPDLRRMQLARRLNFLIPAESLNLLADNGMDWQRQLIVIRAAQFEQQPLTSSKLYLNQLMLDQDNKPSNPRALIYPRQEPAAGLLERLVAESRQQLPVVDWNPDNANPWSDCFKPEVVFDLHTHTLQIVSMLEALWPEGQAIAGETRTLIEAEVQDWSKDLESMGEWQTLALHDLAARLGDESLVKRAQERLLELAKSKPTSADRQWRLACWSAIKSSASMTSVGPLRFRLGEVARNAAAEYGAERSELYTLMTIAQLENYGDPQLRDKVPGVETMIDDVMALVQHRQSFNRKPEALLAHIKINMLLFEKLIAQGNADLAIELLQNMQANNFIMGSKSGLVYRDPDRLKLETQSIDVLGAFQHLIDTKTEPQRLQALLEDLLLKPFRRDATPGRGGAFSDDFRDFTGSESAAPSPSIVVNWNEKFDAHRILDKPTRPLDMYSQLVTLARMNNSLSHLYVRIDQDREKRVAHVVCGALIALEQNRVADALEIYRKALPFTLNVPFPNTVAESLGDSMQIVGDAIFNVVRQDPLSDAALSFSGVALQRPLTAETTDLLRQQFSLATERNRNAAVEKLLEALGKSPYFPAQVREGLRVEYALGLLNAQRVKASLIAYMKGHSKFDKRPTEPDRYVVELMNRLPSLSGQAEIFDSFLSTELQDFPWLDCFAAPATQPLPLRFRNPDASHGLVFSALDKHAQWVSFISWIAEYAELTGQSNVAVEAATRMTVNQIDLVWGAAALAARLNPALTPAALKNRLASANVPPSPTEMQALLDSCQHNEPLRAVAVEIILNLGFPNIALGSPVRDTEPPGWQHWQVLREETFAASVDPRPRWSLAKNGQWTAHACDEPWYLMLRYPIEGDFRLSMNAQQVSGSKFGIGFGGVAAVQSGTDPAVRCLGVGQRRAQDLIPTESPDSTDAQLKVERQGANWTLRAASASFTERADDSVPLIYLVNQGPGTARLDGWQLASELKIARQANLLDSQMRLWRTTPRSWKLPALRVKIAELDLPRPGIVHVTDGTLHLPAVQAATESAMPPSVLHCVRPLAAEETITYEFYASAETAPIHPALGRMLFRLDGDRVMLQWLMRPEDQKWLGLPSTKLFPLDPTEDRQALKIMPDAWNKVELTRSAENRITVSLNGQVIAQVPLPSHLVPEFGLSATLALPAKVRHVQLSGPWPETLSLDQLQLPAETVGK